MKIYYCNVSLTKLHTLVSELKLERSGGFSWGLGVQWAHNHTLVGYNFLWLLLLILTVVPNSVAYHFSHFLFHSRLFQHFDSPTISIDILWGHVCVARHPNWKPIPEIGFGMNFFSGDPLIRKWLSIVVPNGFSPNSAQPLERRDLDLLLLKVNWIYQKFPLNQSHFSWWSCPVNQSSRRRRRIRRETVVKSWGIKKGVFWFTCLNGIGNNSCLKMIRIYTYPSSAMPKGIQWSKSLTLWKGF